MMKKSLLNYLMAICASTCFAVPESAAESTGDERADIARELKLYVEKTIELASAGRPYQEVVHHIGAPHLGHKVWVSAENRGGSIYPPSKLFKEIVIHLARDTKSQQVVAIEFFSNPGSYDMNDLQAAFGDWHRSPKEPEECSFALAWFPRYDASTGAKFFLYAEDGEYASTIDPKRTPDRLFIQKMIARWGD